MSAVPFADLNTLAAHLRAELAAKKFFLLYAYNGTGKTRLSSAFRDLGRAVNESGETIKRNRRSHPFNAFRSLLGIAGGVEAPTYADLYSGAWTHPTSSGCLR